MRHKRTNTQRFTTHTIQCWWRRISIHFDRMHRTKRICYNRCLGRNFLNRTNCPRWKLLHRNSNFHADRHRKLRQSIGIFRSSWKRKQRRLMDLLPIPTLRQRRIYNQKRDFYIFAPEIRRMFRSKQLSIVQKRKHRSRPRPSYHLLHKYKPEYT